MKKTLCYNDLDTEDSILHPVNSDDDDDDKILDRHGHLKHCLPAHQLSSTSSSISTSKSVADAACIMHSCGCDFSMVSRNLDFYVLWIFLLLFKYFM